MKETWVGRLSFSSFILHPSDFTPMPDLDPHARLVAIGTTAVLIIASAVGFVLSRKARTDGAKRTIANLNARTRAWWVMAGVFGASLWFGLPGVTVLFALVSFVALREILTLTPTRRGDHQTLFWVFFVALPVQYYLILTEWYGMFTIMIPVYGFLFLAIRSAVAGDVTFYLERAAKIYWGAMIGVYCLSHVPALMTLNVTGRGTMQWELVAYLAIVVQMSDVLQYTWGKLLGRHKLAPVVSPSKTWEGLIGGVLTATALGAAMHPITPFNAWQAALMSLAICLMGFFGGLVMSAIKRDAGVKDYGQLIEGHGGMLDRVDSLAFAAPVFFHLTRYFFVAPA
jgi:phosphatidate cytidylyltransferase